MDGTAGFAAAAKSNVVAGFAAAATPLIGFAAAAPLSGFAAAAPPLSGFAAAAPAASPGGAGCAAAAPGPPTNGGFAAASHPAAVFMDAQAVALKLKTASTPIPSGRIGGVVPKGRVVSSYTVGGGKALLPARAPEPRAAPSASAATAAGQPCAGCGWLTCVCAHYVAPRLVRAPLPAGTRCRVCFDGDSDSDGLVSPCACRGDSLYVHESCLLQWAATSTKAKAYYACPTCQTAYFGAVAIRLAKARVAKLRAAAAAAAEASAAAAAAPLPPRRTAALAAVLAALNAEDAAALNAALVAVAVLEPGGPGRGGPEAAADLAAAADGDVAGLVDDVGTLATAEALRLANALMNLAVVLSNEGEDAQSEAALRESVSLREAALGPDHPQLATANTLAWRLNERDAAGAPADSARQWLRQNDDALILQLQSAAAAAEASKDDVALLRALCELGRFYEATAFGDADAESCYRKALALRPEAKDVPRCDALALLASLLTKRVVRRVCDDGGDAPRRRTSAVHEAARDLAVCSEAKKYSLEAYEMAKRVLGERHPAALSFKRAFGTTCLVNRYLAQCHDLAARQQRLRGQD
ncbi:hypothetical protein M885DRAFT_226428 [Pelagophyceae sp. CCMP2097]|nr:hypothetical protein M885DRAFT_226428 [Pelagophyceae sp. CCMP2097]